MAKTLSCQPCKPAYWDEPFPIMTQTEYKVTPTVNIAIQYYLKATPIPAGKRKYLFHIRTTILTELKHIIFGRNTLLKAPNICFCFISIIETENTSARHVQLRKHVEVQCTYTFPSDSITQHYKQKRFFYFFYL